MARHATQQRFDPVATLEAGQVAGDDLSRGCQAHEALHRRKRHTQFVGDLRIKPLTVFPEALQGVDLFSFQGSCDLERSIHAAPPLAFAQRIFTGC